jgi:hypothetical protein
MAEKMSEPVPAITRAVKVDGVELVLGIEDQRLVERARMQFARLFAVQQVQEMCGDRIVVGFGLDATAVMAELVPVQQHRTETRHQPVGDVARFVDRARVLFRKYRAEHRTTGAHHVHRMRVRRQQFQRVLHLRRQAAQTLQLGLVCRQFRACRQVFVHEQVRDFLERRLLGQVLDVVAAVVQVVAGTANRADRGIAGRDAGQRDGFLGFEGGGAGIGCGHDSRLPYFFFANNASSAFS